MTLASAERQIVPSLAFMFSANVQPSEDGPQ
jgi:hypothetical protein